MTQVIWLRAASEKLRMAFINSSYSGKKRTFSSYTKDINQILAGSFPNAASIVVTDRLSGYSNKQKKEIFRVEVVDRQGKKSTSFTSTNGSSIVKIADKAHIEKEYNGWYSCLGPGGRGRIFMPVTQGKGTVPNCESLIYRDAQDELPIRSCSLEEAVENCCIWGDPVVESIVENLTVIFLELSTVIYAFSRTVIPDRTEVAWFGRKLKVSLRNWHQPGSTAHGVLERVISELPNFAMNFFEPCDYYSNLVTDPVLLPRMQKGSSHGDLHGRNILVGITDGRAYSPSIFDYEDMGTDNLLAWDFVKLETELKVRMYREIFDGNERYFLRKVHGFETRLAEATEANFEYVPTVVRNQERSGSAVDSLPELVKREDRLMTILLSIRKSAKMCLEKNRDRNNSWLHEYYFFLLSYGVYTARFPEYGQRELMAAYLSAGIAASRYSWSIKYREEIAAKLAVDAIQKGNAKARFTSVSPVGYYPELRFASEFVRTGEDKFVQAGIKILKELTGQYEHILDIRQELALAYLEMYSLTKNVAWRNEATALLDRVKNSMYPHEETFCRLGRLFKDKGDENIDSNPKEARKAYRDSLKWYQHAYDIRKNYYAGVNVATLHLLLKRRAKAVALAKEVEKIIDGIDMTAVNEEEWHWVYASHGEASLILCDFDQAINKYNEAIIQSHCKPWDQHTMYKQVQRILSMNHCENHEMCKDNAALEKNQSRLCELFGECED